MIKQTTNIRQSLRNFAWEDKQPRNLIIINKIIIVTFLLIFSWQLITYHSSIFGSPIDSNADLDYSGPPFLSTEDTFFVSFTSILIACLWACVFGWFIQKYVNRLKDKQIKWISRILIVITCILSMLFIVNYYERNAQSFVISFLISGLFLLPAVFINLFKTT